MDFYTPLRVERKVTSRTSVRPGVDVDIIGQFILTDRFRMQVIPRQSFVMTGWVSLPADKVLSACCFSAVCQNFFDFEFIPPFTFGDVNP